MRDYRRPACRYPWLRALAAGIVCLLCASVSVARPDMSPLGPNIADKGSAFYHFTVNRVDSADGQRHYKIWTAIPDKAPPAQGYPVLYLLDGNAVMDRLTDSLLGRLSQQDPPVLVVIGYQTSLPFDLSARSFDYTPAPAGGSAGQVQQDKRGRPVGGSDIFRQLLEEKIAPLAEQGLHVDVQRRGIWGHSFGGLWVLDSYLKTDFFRQFYSASPSLGQAKGDLLRQVTSASGPRLQNKQLLVMEGDGDATSPRAQVVDILSDVRQAIESLDKRHVAAGYRLFPGLTHGQMFTASFRTALLLTAQVPVSATETAP